jgi:hypothetical protein
MIRYNTSLNDTEYYDGISWKSISDTGVEATGGTIVDTEVGGIAYRIHTFTTPGSSTFTVTKGGEVEYLIVAGGGGGGRDNGGGGGAGGLLTGFITVTSQTYDITVGDGGLQFNVNFRGFQGGNSSAFGLTAIGGGGGGGGDSGGSQSGTDFANSQLAGGSGGSGGGGASEGGNGAGGAGTAGQGNAGGAGLLGSGGGGGGAGEVGKAATAANSPGNGGNGISSIISGTLVHYAGGGGGAPENSQTMLPGSGLGGLGGGGRGNNPGEIGFNGARNTGGGGGGAQVSQNAGNGGSGIVILRYRRNASTQITPTKVLKSTMPYNFNVEQDRLLLHLDAANPASYPGTGTTWFDLSGNNNNGTLIGGVSYSNDNQGVLVFDGIDDYVDIINPDLSAVSNYTIIGASRVFNLAGRTFSARTNNWLMGNYIGSTESYFANGWVTRPNSGRRDTLWRIFTATRIDTTYRFYVNGVLLVSNTQGTAGPAGFQLGRYNTNTQYSNSQISFLLAYNRTLTEQEILENFNAYKGRFGI